MILSFQIVVSLTLPSPKWAGFTYAAILGVCSHVRLMRDVLWVMVSWVERNWGSIKFRKMVMTDGQVWATFMILAHTWPRLLLGASGNKSSEVRIKI